MNNNADERKNRFINDNFMPKAGRKAPAITPVELAQKIFTAAKKCEEYCEENDLRQNISNLLYENATFQRDNKFSMNFENLDVGPACTMNLSEMESGQAALSGISEFGDETALHPAQVGFIQRPSGFSFLGIVAGGDWQYPAYICVYWDGKKLRMYIPIRGNAVNAVLGCAFGDEDNVECIQKAKKYLQPGHSVDDAIQSTDDMFIPIVNKKIIIGDYLAQFDMEYDDSAAGKIPLDMDGILEDIDARIVVI